jgi:hypothetical protein
VALPARTVEVMAMSPLRIAGRISPVNRQWDSRPRVRC